MRKNKSATLFRAYASEASNPFCLFFYFNWPIFCLAVNHQKNKNGKGRGKENSRLFLAVHNLTLVPLLENAGNWRCTITNSLGFSSVTHKFDCTVCQFGGQIRVLCLFFCWNQLKPEKIRVESLFGDIMYGTLWFTRWRSASFAVFYYLPDLPKPVSAFLTMCNVVIFNLTDLCLHAFDPLNDLCILFSIPLSRFLIRLCGVFTKLHKAFKKIGQKVQTCFTDSWKLRSFWPAKKSSGTHFDASGCICLAGLNFPATLTSHHWASNQLTMAHFAACYFYHA